MKRAILMLLLAGCCLAVDAPMVRGAQENEANVANLQDQLETILKARRPADVAYIKKVVGLVATDRLPLALVKSTLQWTRQNLKAQKYPLIYFQRLLTRRAKKLGITV